MLFFRKVDTKLRLNTTFHAQMECVSGVLNKYLRNLVGVDQ